MEDQAKPPVDLTNFIDTLKSLTDQAALLQGMPEVQNGARLESAVNGISKRVDTLGEQMEEVMATLQTIERRLAKLTEPTHRAGPDDAQLDGNEGDTHPEQTVATAREALLSGRWVPSVNLFLEILGEGTGGKASVKRQRLRQALNLSNGTALPWSSTSVFEDMKEALEDAVENAVEDTLKGATEVQLPGES
ncbi:hypothetical protein Purlil1_14310 [Purpureocillium lilacinum]|uniref:Uncharacterized protein n=1 Tax=Purpureocillium lilacinum TaxID=33203 RepID=A0ABR0BBM0_PURLI|nr:hypothetical protein Purlil1_14310 [Purpureocillium lilacinum]